VRRPRDPDLMTVKEINSRAFLWWQFDEGVSGTLTLTMEAAKKLALELESIVLMHEERNKNV
jgi:hypothetical protein